jgi:uncharacterized protein YabE (DUF348 family)
VPREADPIAEHGTRRTARQAHGHGHNHDVRARHYALRAVRPSPARTDAPEPDVWFPLVPMDAGAVPIGLLVDGPFEALVDDATLAAEMEALELDASRADFTTELRELEADFWTTAARRLEEVAARIPPAPDPAPARAKPHTLPAPRTTGERRHRHRVAGTVIVVAVLGAFAAVLPGVVGASAPQRDITVSIDGRTFARTVRAATVRDVLRMEDIALGPQDRAVPSPATALRTGMAIEVLRAFPVDVDVDGVVRTVRTTVRSPVALKHELEIGAGLVIGSAPRELTAGTRVSFRTPHDVTLQVDGRTIIAPRTAALDVGALLAAHSVALGPHDEVTPGPSTRLANGMRVRVYRLAEGEIAEHVEIPFTTETRDDPNLPVGQTKVIQGGSPGIQRSIYRVVTREDGTVVTRVPRGSEVLHPPVAQVVVRGTQPIPPKASGSATWYGTGPGPGTCAHLTLRFGTIVTMTNLANGATARCRVADRGPESWTGHVIDLSPDVFRRLAPLSQGVIPRLALSY